MSRKKILTSLKEALKTPSNLPEVNPNIDENITDGIELVTPKTHKLLIDQFKRELELVNGEYHSINKLEQVIEICSSISKEVNFNKISISGNDICNEIVDNLKEANIVTEIISTSNLNSSERKIILSSISVALVEASFAIADTGSLVFIYNQTKTSLPHFLSDCVIALIKKENIIANQFQLFNTVSKEEAKNMFFVTGPSRTADIEKVLILGAHGPRRLIVIAYE